MHMVDPLNKGHVGDSINSVVFSFIERLSSFRGSQCNKTIGKVIFGTLSNVLCREVYCTVSLFQRVHYQRFHCNTIKLDRDHNQHTLLVWRASPFTREAGSGVMAIHKLYATLTDMLQRSST